ncbi:hypothetical protein GIB67_021101 [Kingdonia uniflora]|uniref:Phytocyanin domain-containing protein n=1 Tax=Kingdonia uniflora TaxID=39325 RepID=A0A7J7N7C0_9MAGN|nr:hypothetical protein GIB67_021101 [Kingdonia uniflora]
MANTLSLSKQTNKVFRALGLFILLVLMQTVGATEFKVGGSNGWTVSSDSDALLYNQWAKTHRFQVGDSLLFVYNPNKDMVFQVNNEDYNKCNTVNPIATFEDGNTSFKLNQSGAHYFISGVKDNCLKNEKMVVVVLSDRSKNNPTPSSPTPPPPSRNGASSSFVVSFIRHVGALVGSYVLFGM